MICEINVNIYFVVLVAYFLLHKWYFGITLILNQIFDGHRKVLRCLHTDSVYCTFT